MRWKERPRRHKIGEERVVRRFLWFPKKLTIADPEKRSWNRPEEWRWLEMAVITQRWYAGFWWSEEWCE